MWAGDRTPNDGLSALPIGWQRSEPLVVPIVRLTPESATARANIDLSRVMLASFEWLADTSRASQFSVRRRQQWLLLPVKTSFRDARSFRDPVSMSFLAWNLVSMESASYCLVVSTTHRRSVPWNEEPSLTGRASIV